MKKVIYLIMLVNFVMCSCTTNNKTSIDISVVDRHGMNKSNVWFVTTPFCTIVPGTYTLHFDGNEMYITVPFRKIAEADLDYLSQLNNSIFIQPELRLLDKDSCEILIEHESYHEDFRFYADMTVGDMMNFVKRPIGEEILVTFKLEYDPKRFQQMLHQTTKYLEVWIL